MSEDPEVSYPLTDEMRRMLEEYADACNTRDAAEELRAKARDALVAFLGVHDANVGTVNGKPVCAVAKVDRETIDVARLREEEPAIARRYARLSTVERFTLKGRYRVS